MWVKAKQAFSDPLGGSPGAALDHDLSQHTLDNVPLGQGGQACPATDPGALPITQLLRGPK